MIRIRQGVKEKQHQQIFQSLFQRRENDLQIFLFVEIRIIHIRLSKNRHIENTKNLRQQVRRLRHPIRNDRVTTGKIFEQNERLKFTSFDRLVCPVKIVVVMPKKLIPH